MSHNVRKVDQHATKHENERVLLASSNEKLKLDIEANKEIHKDLKKVNTSLSQELWYCKNELEKYKVFQTNCKEKKKADLKCKEALGLLADTKRQCDESLKREAYRTFLNDLANIFAPKSEETILLSDESRSKLEFSNDYDLLLQECLSNDIMCAILCSFDNINEQTELQCLYLEKCQECENLELELSKSTTQQTNKRFSNLDQHCIELELALQHEKEKNESVGLNDMVHNYYLEEAKKKAQLQKDKALNSKPKKPRNQKPFLKSNDLACPTCKKCIYTANHDACILKYLFEVNSRAYAQKKDAQSYKTTKRYIPVGKKSDSKKPGRQIPNKTTWSMSLLLVRLYFSVFNIMRLIIDDDSNGVELRISLLHSI
ncbi:hypothetical protein Tco_0704900 [Tanacetum coccineum]|uniref:Uncharacterized protein n=1 Tax=Tanacetum coccineum TaxID=301880 RepID=A0ABQ4Y355_9ASTR